MKSLSRAYWSPCKTYLDMGWPRKESKLAWNHWHPANKRGLVWTYLAWWHIGWLLTFDVLTILNGVGNILWVKLGDGTSPHILYIIRDSQGSPKGESFIAWNRSIENNSGSDEWGGLDEFWIAMIIIPPPGLGQSEWSRVWHGQLWG